MPSDQVEIKRQCFLHQISQLIRDANLNKIATSSLLSLLESLICCNQIPTSPEQLFQQLGIKFHYDAYVFCSTCFTSLERFQDRCSYCKISVRKANSELIVFSVADELQRVVESNIELIKWYSIRENQLNSDIVHGKSVNV